MTIPVKLLDIEEHSRKVNQDIQSPDLLGYQLKVLAVFLDGWMSVRLLFIEQKPQPQPIYLDDDYGCYFFVKLAIWCVQTSTRVYTSLCCSYQTYLAAMIGCSFILALPITNFGMLTRQTEALCMIPLQSKPKEVTQMNADAVKGVVIVIVTILFMFCNIWVLMWFLIKHGAAVSPFNRNKLVCMLLENFYINYMLAAFFCNREWQQVLRWCKRLCYFSLGGFVFELMFSQVTTGMVAFKFVKEDASKVDPALSPYLLFWGSVYYEWFFCVAMFSFVLMVYSIDQWRVGAIENAQNYRTSQQVENRFRNHFGILAYNGTSAQKNCPICLSDYNLNENVVECPCKHTFHHDCITEWLQTKNTCPLCRQNVFDVY